MKSLAGHAHANTVTLVVDKGGHWVSETRDEDEDVRLLICYRQATRKHGNCLYEALAIAENNNSPVVKKKIMKMRTRVREVFTKYATSLTRAKGEELTIQIMGTYYPELLGATFEVAKTRWRVYNKKALFKTNRERKHLTNEKKAELLLTLGRPLSNIETYIE